MIEAVCHCGSVKLQIARAPTEATECNCSICRRYGVIWAYYSLQDVILPSPEATETYAWDDRSIAFHRCRRCGCISHWYPITREDDRLGINARLLDPGILAGTRIRHLDGAGTERYID